MINPNAAKLDLPDNFKGHRTFNIKFPKFLVQNVTMRARQNRVKKICDVQTQGKP